MHAQAIIESRPKRVTRRSSPLTLRRDQELREGAPTRGGALEPHAQRFERPSSFRVRPFPVEPGIGVFTYFVFVFSYFVISYCDTVTI